MFCNNIFAKIIVLLCILHMYIFYYIPQYKEFTYILILNAKRLFFF